MDQSRHRCRRCLIFAQSPLNRDALNSLRVRDLKWFLSSRNINSDTYSVSIHFLIGKNHLNLPLSDL